MRKDSHEADIDLCPRLTIVVDACDVDGSASRRSDDQHRECRARDLPARSTGMRSWLLLATERVVPVWGSLSG